MKQKKNKREKSDLVRFRRINKFIIGKDVLDIGSSEGSLHELLKRSNPERIIFSMDKIGNVDFIVDLNKPIKINKKFDTVIAGEIIEHLESPINFIKYCNSLLKIGGRIIITTPNASGLQYLLNPNWCVNYEEYIGHRQTFTIPMLNKLVEENKFEYLSSEYINAFWDRSPLRFMSLFVKRLRPDIMIVAKKVGNF
ncbi:MAG: class I SAM-dependent methyltransferase [Candidatus Pacearchaeota archaeon]|jgi:cyclopropane fatty-acyl-phospholipid synthase-like methyltransferase